MVFDYTDNDEYNGVAGCICLELLLSYRELANLHCEEDNTYIIKRIEIVNFHQCKILFRRVSFFLNTCTIRHVSVMFMTNMFITFIISSNVLGCRTVSHIVMSFFEKGGILLCCCPSVYRSVHHSFCSFFLSRGCTY